ncbi:MAG: glycosyltransferase family 4 protein [Candidatus Promineifilaceae bacterium]
MSHPLHIAVVVPRYGPDAIGGAENLGRGFAEEMARRGHHIEAWTTCASSHFTWENVYPAGRSELNGVVVRRFPITSHDKQRRHDIETKVITSGKLSIEEQYSWLESAAHSVPLYRHVAEHASEFDAIIALPYANPLTHYAAWAASDKVIFWPCLHDEPYAYMEPVRLLLERVWGVMFNAPEESYLTLKKLKIRPRHSAVPGAGVLLPDGLTVKANGHLTGSPYIAYVGRLEGGKNIPLLYTYMKQHADRGGRVRLVVMGKGPLEPPKHPAFDFRGFVSDEEIAKICGSALALCQPSLNESFSLVIMQSWLAGRPVLVPEACDVTREHVRRSKGGLWFNTADEFGEALDWLADHPDLASRMGRNGRDYVLQNYTWATVAERFERAVGGW